MEELLSFATSAIRDAVNGDDVLAFIREKTDVDVLARLYCLAVVEEAWTL